MKRYFHEDNSSAHILFNLKDLDKRRLDFFQPDYQFQLSAIHLKKDEEVKAHKHLLNKKSDIKVITHEIWVAFQGNASVKLFSENKLLDTVLLERGSVLITFPNAGHSIKVETDDFVFLEFKNTPFFPELIKKM